MNKPNVYLFNPTCEYAIANGNASWQPNRILQKMEADLSALPLFFASKVDCVLVDEIPSAGFLNSLSRLDIEPPKFISKKDFLKDEDFLKLPKNKLLPWGWSPVAHKLLAPLKPSCSEQFQQSPVFNWNPEQRNLYSKKFALGIAKEFQEKFPSPFFIEKDKVAQVCATKQEFELLLKKWGKLMVKAPWSSSGRGLQPITKIPIHEKVWEKLLGMVKEQGYTIVEPYLDKKLDLAFQFELAKGKVSYLGISNFSTDRKGKYIGNNLNGLPPEMPRQLIDFALALPGLIIKQVSELIERSELATKYEGNFGVDTLIYSDENKRLKVNPCLEINVRQNMGYLSLFLERLVAPEKHGTFRTFYNGKESFLQFKRVMEKRYPLELVENKINSGFFAVTDACESTMFGAYLLV